MKPLEALYLLIGVGIVVRGTIDHGLTVTELGAALFFVGLVPVTRADRKAAEGEEPLPILMRRIVTAWLERGPK